MPKTTIDSTSTEKLKALEGCVLKHCSGYRLFEDPDVYFGRVRLSFDKSNLDFENKLNEIEIDNGGSTETAGLLAVKISDDPIWVPAEEKVHKQKLGLKVQSVYIVEDTICLMKGNTELSTQSFTQAIVLKTEGGYIGFDKGVWFDEYITVTQGDALEDVVRDCSEDWVTDEPFWNEFSRKVIQL